MTHHDPVLRILRDARSILADHGFCKYRFAERANGAPCQPLDARAVAYCSLGAIYAAARLKTDDAWNVASGQEFNHAKEACREIEAVTGCETHHIADWNNKWFRTKRGVLRKFDKAIAYREAEAPPELSAPADAPKTAAKVD